VVVLVGTALNPSKMRRPPTFPGITIRTLWGEMAAQIAEQAGDQKLYDLVKDADLRSVSPGSETLRELFDAGGPCVVLIDELVAYARKLYGVDGLPAGSFDNVLTFVQELTEAARQSRNSMVIASIPESDIEIGGDAGREALARIGHTFERMEAIWKPVGAEEGFEIVRRRLFLDIKDTPSRDDVCRAFSRMYAEGGAEFPVEAKEAAYAERMKRCYPIHPEVFDRLYNEWASMERFQKTRGVLRLMASVIHELWVRKDPGLLIMPGSIPIDAIAVREELLRHLPDGWSPVVESDVDGGRSTPKRLDAGNVRLGEYCAARRVAGTVFLGSAPSVKEQNVRGIENTRIRLGVAEPDDQVAVYNDALSRLRDKLAFLYNSGSRYWYDTRPNLRRTMEDRAQQVTEEAIDMEMDRRLKAIRDRADFAGVHICPTGSSDVGDDQRVRLVVLSHRHPHKANQADTAAVAAAADILNNRGSGPRLNRNMLVFVAPDKDLLPVLVSEIRKYLAWKSILADAEALNLDAHQKTEANSSHLRSDGTVALRVQEAFIWLLVPTRQPEDKATSFDVVRLSATKDGCVIEAAKRLRTSGQLITKWSPDLLQMELDQWFWADTDDVNTQKVWDSLAQYVYLSRLKDVDVFLEAVRDGVRSGKWGYAHSKAEDGTYAGLQLGDASGSLYVNATSLLVKPDVARKQIEAEKGAIAIPSGENAGESGPLFVSGGVAGATAFTPTESQSAAARIKRRFHGSVDLGDRVGAAAARIADEVLSHLQGLPKARVKVTMEIDADIPDGAPDHVIRTVTENARQLKFTDQGFEEE
jgi:predicted AAA+ superfamily ATPase